MGCDESCHLDVLPALRGDEPIVRDILGDVQRWLASRGIVQWTTPINDDWIGEKIAAGEFHIARTDNVPVAVARLLWADPLFWGDRDRHDAAYIHTMAVRRDHAGHDIGERILHWAGEQARARNRRFLRLDCGADNAALGDYYRRLGFTAWGAVPVGGATVTLLEKDLA